MKFISLIDIASKNTITIDADAHILRLELGRDRHIREARLKPYHAEILYKLFNKHPLPLDYLEITSSLQTHGLTITDSTRMHRKLSEIRNFMGSFHPSLKDLILNTRGLGYSLPLALKNLHQLEHNQKIQFKNLVIHNNIILLKGLIEDAINLTAQSNVVKKSQGYVINRESIKAILVEKITIFNNCEQIIIEQICVHEADFIAIRVQYLLAKLRTYIGLTRISEYPISEVQWLDWFKQEIWLVFDDLNKILKLAENF